MVEPRLKHVGADAILAERTKLLGLYDTAKAQVADDPVKVDHGNVAEDIFRRYLARFLPKKYGVAKGHILTRDLTYEGPMEEWDIIIYDVMECPVLFVRDESSSTPRLGIPVQFVNAIVEVKAALTQASAHKVAEKLLKLERFKRPSESNSKERGDYLPWGFFSMAVFFETATASKNDYRKCLDKLQPLGIHKFTQFEQALILRSQNDAQASGIISSLISGESEPGILFGDERIECSDAETLILASDLPDVYSFTVSYGFGLNVFPSTMMDVVSRLNDGPMRGITGGSTNLIGFGHDPEGIERRSLWPADQK